MCINDSLLVIAMERVVTSLARDRCEEISGRAGGKKSVRYEAAERIVHTNFGLIARICGMSEVMHGSRFFEVTCCSILLVIVNSNFSSKLIFRKKICGRMQKPYALYKQYIHQPRSSFNTTEK